MRLRLPLLLLSVVMAAYVPGAAYGASFDLNGTENDQELTLSDGELLSNSSATAGTQSGLLTIGGSVVFGGPGNYTIGGGVAGSGNVTLTGGNTVTIAAVAAASATYTGSWIVNETATLAVNLEKDKVAGLGAGSVTLKGGTLLVESVGAVQFAFSNQIILDGTSTLKTKNRPRIAMGGKILGTGDLIMDAGSGGQVELHGFQENKEDTFEGNLIIKTGTVRLGSGDIGKLTKGKSYWLGTGDIKVESGATLQMWMSGNGAMSDTFGILNGLQIRDKSTVYLDSGSYNFEGNVTWDNEATAAFSFNWGCKVDIKGVLGGSGVFDVNTTQYSNNGSLSLSNNENTFSGRLNVNVNSSALATGSNVTFTLDLLGESVAKNMDIFLTGREDVTNAKAVLKISSARSVISSLNGNTKGIVNAGAAGNTLVLTNGGDYYGSFGTGLVIENQGVLTLGRAAGVTMDNVISGSGELQMVAERALTLSGVSTYTGKTVLNAGAVLTLASNGSLAGTSAVIMNAGSTLTLAANSSISASSSLSMNSGNLVINSGKTQTFNGTDLKDGSSSTLVISGAGSGFAAGDITGSGMLIVEGVSSIGGNLGADKSYQIAFKDGAIYYNAAISGGTITKGAAFEEIAANSNNASKSYMFRNTADITMDNASGTLYTVGNLFVSGTGKKLTLGAGGLNIKGGLTYNNEDKQSTTIAGGKLTVGSISKTGAGEFRFDSTVESGSLLVDGKVIFANGGTVTQKVMGTGTIALEGAGKILLLSGDMSGFMGSADLAAGTVMQIKATETPAFTNVTGTGTFKVDSGQINIVGATCVDPKGNGGAVSTFTGVGFDIAKDGVVFVDHRGLTSSSETTGIPYAPRTIKNLTGSGTLILKTAGGDATGGYPGHAGTSVYVGEQGFNGRIVVQQGFLGFYECDWGNATIVIDGGALGNGTYHKGSYSARTRNNNIEVTSAGGIIRLFGSDNLTLNGTLSGSGDIQRTDGGTLTINGNTSGYSGNMTMAGGTTTFNGSSGFGILTLSANTNLKGASTSMKGLVHKSGTLVVETSELTIGAGGITATDASWTATVSVGTFKASDDWTLASNIILEQKANTGFVMDTQGHDVTFDGRFSFASGVTDAGKKIVKNGAGTWTLKQDWASLASSVEVNGGMFRYEGSGFSAAVSMANGGILNFSKDQTLTKSVTGTGVINLDKNVRLDIQGQILNGNIGLVMNGGNTVNFAGGVSNTLNLGNFTVSSLGNKLVFQPEGDMIINMKDTLLSAGCYLAIENYNYSDTNYLKMDGLTAWEMLDGVYLSNKDGLTTNAMVDTRGRLIAFTEDIVVGNLVSSGVKSDGSGYLYEGNTQYYGSLEGKNADFSQPFQFASGAATYGFTTRDDRDTGIRAGSFTVSGRLTDGDSVSRTVSILGQEGAEERTVTFTNVKNSFTGNLTLTRAVLKVKAADTSLIGAGPVTILGVGNSVYLNEKAMLDMATGNGAYTYSNNFILNGDDSVLRQTEGQHTLTGSITLSGTGNGNRVVENTLEDGTLTLTGNLVSRGGSTLVLQTKNGKDSRIVLSANGDSSLNRLVVNGHVEQTKNTLSVANGMTLGNQASYLLGGGTLAVGEKLTSSGGTNRTVTFGNGTTLRALSERLIIDSGIVLAFAHEQSSFALDTGSATVEFRGNLGNAASDNVLTKRGQGSLEWGSSTTTKANLKIEQGTLTLKEGVNLSTTGDVNVQNGSILNLEKGSSLNVSPNSNFAFNGSLMGSGSLSGMNKLTFGGSARYGATMSSQNWDVVFQNGSTFSGSLLRHTGNIVFEEGSHIRFDTTLPISDNSIGISTTGSCTVRFNGAIVSGSSSTPDVDWDVTKTYEFTLVKSQKELLGKDGQKLTSDNMEQSVVVGDDGWGAFLQGELGISESGKELLVTVSRNGNTIGSYAQTSNQSVVGGALDYGMDNYSSLGLRGTELGDIIQYFNKMGQNIAAEAPEALGMVGGLSNYQALAGQRTDMMRHVEAVRQRAHAGKGLVGISNIPDNSFWAEGTQSYSRVDGVDNSAPGYTAQTWGGAIGVDYLSGPNYSLGVAFAYSNMKVDSNQYAGQTKSDNYYIDLYGRWESGNWNGVVVLSGGTASVDVKRTLYTGTDTYQGKGSADGTQIIGMAEVAYDWQWEEEGPVLQPYLGMTVGGSKLDGYTESGLGNAGLVLDEQKQTVAQASLGVRLFRQNIDREMQYETSRWELRCGLVEEFGDTDFVTRSSFLGLPGYTMSTTSDDIGRTGLQIGGGFSYAFDQAWSVFGDVNGEFRNGQTNMNSTLGLRCTF